MTEDIARVNEFVAAEHGLAMVATSRQDGSIQCSVVNAGVLEHPPTGEAAVAFVTGGGSLKLRNLRARPAASVVFRSGWRWVTVEGRATIVGPDDPAEGITADRLRELLREVFTAAGGTHDDWEEYDRVMAAERRAVVLVDPERIYSNG